jgi:hypothetical protein
MAVKVAWVPAPKVAAMATMAKAPSPTSRPGSRLLSADPTTVPNDALMSRIGARVPPEVPDPRASHQARSLPAASAATVPSASRASSTSPMAS